MSEIDFDPTIEHPESSGVPEDCVIDLPFPLLIATNKDKAIVCKIHKNEFFTLAIIELFPSSPDQAGRPLEKAIIRFGATPPNVQVGDYWKTAIETSARLFYTTWEMNQMGAKPAALATPQKPTLAVIRGGVVTDG